MSKSNREATTLETTNDLSRGCGLFNAIKKWVNQLFQPQAERTFDDARDVICRLIRCSSPGQSEDSVPFSGGSTEAVRSALNAFFKAICCL